MDRSRSSTPSVIAVIRGCMRPILSTRSERSTTNAYRDKRRSPHAGFHSSLFDRLAERVGFEPTVATRATTVFETVPFNHSGTSPRWSCAPNYSIRSAPRTATSFIGPPLYSRFVRQGGIGQEGKHPCVGWAEARPCLEGATVGAKHASPFGHHSA